MVTLANAFAARGLCVDLVLAQAKGPYLEDISPDVRIIDLGAPRVVLGIPALVRYLRQARPEAMLSAMTHANVAALLVRRLAKWYGRLVVSEHSTRSQVALMDHSVNGRLVRWLARRWYQQAESVVAVSRSAAHDLEQQLGWQENRVVPIYNPFNVKRISKLAEEPISHPWFRKKGPPVLLSIGRLTEAKDLQVLLHAFAFLHAHQTLRLMILGEGQLRGKLEKLAHQLGVAQDVAMPGFVRNPYAYMRQCDVFVLSSRWEGLSNVLIEALIVGSRIVATDCPSGPREILEEGRWGTLVPVADPTALANAIEASLDMSRLPPEVGNLNRFSQDTVVERYLSVLGLDPDGGE